MWAVFKIEDSIGAPPLIRQISLLTDRFGMEFRVVGWGLQRRMRWSWQSVNVLIVPVSDSAYSKHCKICTDLSLSLPWLIIVLPLKTIVHMVSPGSWSLQWDPAKTCRPFHDAAKWIIHAKRVYCSSCLFLSSVSFPSSVTCCGHETDSAYVINGLGVLISTLD